MPKKISELPKTTTLSNDDVFVVNREGATNIITTNNLRNNITNNISISASQLLPSNANNGDVLTFDGIKWTPKAPVQTGGIPNFGNDIIVGFFLPPGTDKKWIVPVGLSNIEIISQGSGGDGGNANAGSAQRGVIQSHTILGGATILISTINIIQLKYSEALFEKRNGGKGGDVYNFARGITGSGGGAGGWVRKTLTVTPGQIFTYTCGIIGGSCTISSGSWSMTAGAGTNAGNAGNTTVGSIGLGGIVSGDYTEGYNGESGSKGRLYTVAPDVVGSLGGRGRDLKGVLGAPGSEIGGYIYIKIK